MKGCYLGQETVARIDALGHVNKVLKGLRFEAEALPRPGSTLEADGKPAGTITSVALAEDGRGIGLGYVRIAIAAAGTVLEVAGEGPAATARVVELPMTDDR